MAHPDPYDDSMAGCVLFGIVILFGTIVGEWREANKPLYEPVDIGGWSLAQANAALNYTIPTGTLIRSHGYVIVARNATKAQFEAFWGVTLGANVTYVNTGDGMPQINGSETYTLKNAGGSTVDGPTVGTDASAGKSLQRANCGAVGSAGTWTKVRSTSGTPGKGGLTGCGKGVFINEFSDALGTENFIYEFVELFNDNPIRRDVYLPKILLDPISRQREWRIVYDGSLMDVPSSAAAQSCDGIACRDL